MLAVRMLVYWVVKCSRSPDLKLYTQQTFDVKLDLLYMKLWFLVPSFVYGELNDMGALWSASIVAESCASALKFNLERDKGKLN